MKYRPEIDGLRALAVVPVILFHAGFELFSGGFVGVDVFFVISGYLITTLLIEEIENDQFSIINFYERRARRILPALFFVMFVCVPFAWMWMMPSQMQDFTESLMAVSLFASNFLFWQQSGYFATAAEEIPLLHTWSLAVEEQYYLLFPVFLLLAWRFGKNKVFWLIVVLTVISFSLSQWGWRKDLNANFYLAPARVWELFAGSLASFVVQKRGVQENNGLSMLGVVAILSAIFVYDETTPFPGAYALVPVVGAVLFVLYAGKETLAAKLLSTKAFVGVGLISYSAYLWHQPLFAFARIKLIGEPSLQIMTVLTAASLILAVGSYKYVEKPIRRRSFLSQRIIFAASLVGILGFVAIGLAGYKSKGFVERFSLHAKGDVGHLAYHEYIDNRYHDCEPESIAKNALTWEGSLRCKQSKKGESDWILLGDSHAEHLFLGLAERNKEVNIVFYILNARPYVSGSTFKNIFDEISRAKNKKKIFLTMHYLVRNLSDFEGRFGETILFLQKLGHEVILVGDIPRYSINPEACKYRDSRTSASDSCSMPMSEFNKQLSVYEPTLLRLSAKFNIPYISLHDPLCSGESCSMSSGDIVLYRDNNHLNIPGSILVGDYVSNLLLHNPDKK